MSLFEFGVRREALISASGLYRYFLLREWNTEQPIVNFIMLNPSKADAFKDDATIRRCVDYATRWGFGGITVTNLFALRSTDPSALRGHPDPIGPDNNSEILHHARYAKLIIRAWGNEGPFMDRSKIITDKLRSVGLETHHLRLTKRGEPCHPLRLPASLKPTRDD